MCVYMCLYIYTMFVYLYYGSVNSMNIVFRSFVAKSLKYKLST